MKAECNQCSHQIVYASEADASLHISFLRGALYIYGSFIIEVFGDTQGLWTCK